MSLEIWFTFVIAAAALISFPGPTNLMVMAYTLRRGRRAGMITVFGVVPGVTLAMVLSLAGLGALMAASVTLFAIVKWIGVVYLVYLGIRQWRAPLTRDEDDLGTGNRRMLRDAFLVTLLNPKGFVFFTAFFPQFLDTAAPMLPQMFILGSTFLLIVLPVNIAYAMLAGALGTRLKGMRWQRRLNRTGGSMLVGAGVMTATLQRS